MLTLNIAVKWLAGPVVIPEVTDPKPNPDRVIFTDFSWFQSFQENTEILIQRRPEAISSTTFVILVH